MKLLQRNNPQLTGQLGSTSGQHKECSPLNCFCFSGDLRGLFFKILPCVTGCIDKCQKNAPQAGNPPY